MPHLHDVVGPDIVTPSGITPKPDIADDLVIDPLSSPRFKEGKARGIVVPAGNQGLLDPPSKK
jgi:hypothetical protein